jgi:hypothetical protein
VNQFSRLLTPVLLLAIASVVQGTESIEWLGLDGKPILTGALLSVSPDSKQANIRKEDGSIAIVPIETLALADRAVARTYATKDSEFQHPDHQWTSSDGKRHADASVISIDDKTARMTRSDGKVVVEPIDSLATDDRAYLERLQRAVKVTEITASNYPSSTPTAFPGSMPLSSKMATLSPTKRTGSSRSASPHSGVAGGRKKGSSGALDKPSHYNPGGSTRSKRSK